jgi:hypothetical protein
VQIKRGWGRGENDRNKKNWNLEALHNRAFTTGYVLLGIINK